MLKNMPTPQEIISWNTVNKVHKEKAHAGGYEVTALLSHKPRHRNPTAPPTFLAHLPVHPRHSSALTKRGSSL